MELFNRLFKKKNSSKETLTLLEEQGIIESHNIFCQKEGKSWHNMSSMEWVARYSHYLGCGDFRKYEFTNKEFEKWVYEVYNILHGGNIDLIRNKYLTPEEQKVIQEYEF